MTWQRLRFWLNSILATVVIIAACYMGRYYFTFDKENLEIPRQIYTEIYGRVDSQWLKPDIKAAHQHLIEGNPDDFERILLSSLLARWRIKAVAPHSYENLLASFNRGLWDKSFVKDITPVLRQLDRKWTLARRHALKNDTSPTLNFTEDKGVGITVRFGENTITPRLGSELEFSVLSYPGPIINGSVTAYWETKQDPGFSPYRIAQGSFERTFETSGSKILYKIKLDMSAVPEWLVPSTEPVAIQIRSATPVQWQPVGYKLGDSLLLPVEIPAGSSTGK